MGKRIYSFDSLEIGKSYYVVSGIWSGNLLYCGHVHSPKEFTFTFGNSVDSWVNNFNIVACKSRLKIFNAD
ncbi:MAG: hypothetical protein J5527_05205 [Treponema sp.]|nr:hypothetical protein [Treponema sp.]